MKKIYFVLAVLATATLASCIKEEEFKEPTTLEAGTIAFNVGGDVSTRSAEEAPAVSRGITIPLGKVSGTNYTLEETVTTLDALPAAPETRGTPAYTENLGVLYANNLTIHADKGNFGQGTTGEMVFENMGDEQRVGGGWRYTHKYANDPWPTDGSAVGFYLRMPSTQTGVKAQTTGADLYSYANGAFTFYYESPSTAAAMQDILFAYRAISESDYKTNYSTTGLPVLFNHALTGVKFALGNTPEDMAANSIMITKVEFSGLKDKGTCTITPASENGYVDNPTTYSSATAAVWSNLGITAANAKYSAEFTDTVRFAKGGSFSSAGSYPDSFAAAGADRNLNDAAATQTFWFIPQNFGTEEGLENVTLTVYYTCNGATNHWDIDFGAVLKTAGVNWKAGQIRTYTIKIDDVNVMIEDEVTVPATATAANCYEGSSKSDVTITNTGNTKAFIRAAIVGQWLDVNGDPIFGFTDKINNLYIVESWYEDQFVTEDHDHGYFVGLPGYLERNGTSSTRNNNPLNDWTLCSDGYYYYTKVVDPEAETAPLFTSYTVGVAPRPEIAGDQGVNTNMHFVLEISTQAISAIKASDGTVYSNTEWAQAWANADINGTVPTIAPAKN